MLTSTSVDYCFPALLTLMSKGFNAIRRVARRAPVERRRRFERNQNNTKEPTELRSGTIRNAISLVPNRPMASFCRAMNPIGATCPHLNGLLRSSVMLLEMRF